jgi:hypothetical protein
MTKRAASPTHRWLNTGIALTGILASLIGANLLQRQNSSTAASVLNGPSPIESSTTIHLPASLVQQNGGEDTRVIELAPIPTVVAPASIPRPRPVARSRSSR